MFLRILIMPYTPMAKPVASGISVGLFIECPKKEGVKKIIHRAINPALHPANSNAIKPQKITAIKPYIELSKCLVPNSPQLGS